jgi:hypothetical protein
MIHLQCPADWEGGSLRDVRSLFMGGGITSCPAWQPLMVDLLQDTDLVVVNPRREHFDTSDSELPRVQIEWEHRYLEQVAARMFWFPCETLCPITLFELGKFCRNPDPLFVGCHPDYKRALDVEIQLRLARPSSCTVHRSLEALAQAIRQWARHERSG